jgi:hypothetical protein
MIPVRYDPSRPGIDAVAACTSTTTMPQITAHNVTDASGAV